jgi:DNA-binding CsgD family transcriptional regulator
MVNEARVCGLQGASERALELATEAEHSPTLRALNDFLACAQQARGFAYITNGRYAEAYTALERLFDPLDPAHHVREQLCGVMFLAEAAAHCGRVEDARKILAEMERIAEITPSPALLANLLYARPVLADDDEAEALYRQGLRADLSRWPWHRARIQHAFGSWLRRQRRVAESRDHLRSAVGAFDVIGATTWAEQARAELRAAGERTRPQGVTAAVAVLSPQELQIARLAAEGRSNREIAEQLFLSPRTVGSHLYRIFPKLNITSRAQLATRLDGA